MFAPAFGALAALALVYCAADVLVPTPSARWPDRPDANPTQSTTSYTFAIDSLAFGDDDGWKGWQRYGFDLDGKTTLATSTDVCTLQKGAPHFVQMDGTRPDGVGIDNSFGSNVVPLIVGGFDKGTGSFSAHMNRWLAQGRFTLQIETSGLELSQHQTNVGLSMQSFPSSDFDRDGGTAPTWGTSEDWPVRNDGLLDASPIRARDTFPGAYVTGGTFVSGVGALTLGAVFQAGPLDLHIAHAVVVMRVDGDRVSGTLAGVLDAEEFILEIRKISGQISTALCGSQFDGIARQIRQTADILGDGSNHAGADCSAISVGIGFTGRRIANPLRTAPPPPDPPDACPPVPEAGPYTPPDAGWDLACQSTGDCQDAGSDGGSDAGPNVCCADVDIAPSCDVAKVSASCRPKASCGTNIQAACGSTATTHLCASAAECDEPLYPKCCALPASGASASPYMCVSTLLGVLGKCK